MLQHSNTGSVIYFFPWAYTCYLNQSRLSFVTNFPGQMVGDEWNLWTCIPQYKTWSFVHLFNLSLTALQSSQLFCLWILLSRPWGSLLHPGSWAGLCLLSLLLLHCKTAEAHVLLNFKSKESGPMTNVITPTSFYIRVLKSSLSCLYGGLLCFLRLKKSRCNTINTSLPLSASCVLNMIFFG